MFYNALEETKKKLKLAVLSLLPILSMFLAIEATIIIHAFEVYHCDCA